MRKLKQWAIAGDDKSPFTLRNGIQSRVSVIDTEALLTFEEACSYAQTHNLGVGFVLHENDPFTCIDIDIKDLSSRDARGQFLSKDKWSTEQDIERYSSIIEQFNSYAEMSTSGKGVHIWVEGGIGQGRRRGGIEVYSRERFIVCTGCYIQAVDWSFNSVNSNWIANPVIGKAPNAIANRQTILNNMIMQLSPVREIKPLQEQPEVESDEVIMQRAASAGNAEKFNKLIEGDWHSDFPSQSEADLALMSMFTFYSPSNEQCRRLFRHSSLGRRDKARKDNRHLDYMLVMIRTREFEEKQALEQIAEMSKQIVSNSLNKSSIIDQNMLAKALVGAIDDAVRTIPEPVTTNTNHLSIKASVELDLKKLQIALEAQEQIIEVPKVQDDYDPSWYDPLEPVTDNGLEWPPGLIGQIAGFIYYSAPRPVREIAITSALGVMAGICGKAWNIPSSGLNMYLVLICQSAIGKEALHQGPAILERCIEQIHPVISTMIDPTNYVSGPAIRKSALILKSTCNFQSEFGRKLKRMADERDNTAAEMRTTMTELYQKSAADAKVGGVAHSKRDENVEASRGVAYSMVGESTPDTFYESLTDSMMEDGFLSRFSIVEYTGPRPPHNEFPNLKPSSELITCMCNMISDADTNNRESGKAYQLGMDADVVTMSRAFSQEMDDMVNDAAGGGGGEKDQSKRQMYNRAHLKFLRLSGLLAVGRFYGEGKSASDGIPRIKMREAKWALDFVKNDIKIMSVKVESGQIGLGESSRKSRLHDIIKSYQARDYKLQGFEELMRRNGVIPYSLLSRQASRSSCFNKHRNGAAKSIKETIYEFIDSGYLSEVPKSESLQEYGAAGRCFRILF